MVMVMGMGRVREMVMEMGIVMEIVMVMEMGMVSMDFGSGSRGIFALQVHAERYRQTAHSCDEKTLPYKVKREYECDI